MGNTLSLCGVCFQATTEVGAEPCLSDRSQSYNVKDQGKQLKHLHEDSLNWLNMSDVQSPLEPTTNTKTSPARISIEPLCSVLQENCIVSEPESSLPPSSKFALEDGRAAVTLTESIRAHNDNTETTMVPTMEEAMAVITPESSTTSNWVHKNNAEITKLPLHLDRVVSEPELSSPSSSTFTVEDARVVAMPETPTESIEVHNDNVETTRVLVDLDELDRSEQLTANSAPLKMELPSKARLPTRFSFIRRRTKTGTEPTASNETICILGGEGVGKTTLAIRLINEGRWVDPKAIAWHDPTIEDRYKVDLSIDGKKSNLKIVDTGGQIEYLGARDEWIRENDCFMLVYSVADRESFYDVKDLKEKIDVSRFDDKRDRKVILVGNKADCAGEDRMVPFKTGAQLAKDWGCRFIECSAKDAINCDRPFHDMIRSIRNSKHLSIRLRKSQSKCCYVM